MGRVEPELTVRYYESNRSPFARLHRSVDLEGVDVTMVDGLPVTTVGRTAADLLTSIGRRRAERVIAPFIAVVGMLLILTGLRFLSRR